MENKSLFEVLHDSVVRSKSDPFWIYTDEVTEEDIQDFMDEWCVFRGDKKGFNEWLVGFVEEEAERRKSHFECGTKEDEEFLETAILQYLVVPTTTIYKPHLSYSSMVDVFNADEYVALNVGDEWFIFDFQFAEFDCELSDDVDGCIDWKEVKDLFWKKKNVLN
jgi:hypothetical protein